MSQGTDISRGHNGQSYCRTLRIGEAELEGQLTVPAAAQGLVVFVHGSGSSRHSPRNQSVARVLNSGHLATLLFDLLTVEEELVDLRTRELRFDIELLTLRTVDAIDWLSEHEVASPLPIGLFGASTGAAAALDAASARPNLVHAVVSRGGRPDLAKHLSLVKAPTLLIVGGLDAAVLDMNRSAARRLSAPTTLEVLPGASHLFEEPGKLGQAAMLAQDWFLEHLGAAP